MKLAVPLLSLKINKARLERKLTLDTPVIFACKDLGIPALRNEKSKPNPPHPSVDVDDAVLVLEIPEAVCQIVSRSTYYILTNNGRHTWDAK